MQHLSVARTCCCHEQPVVRDGASLPCCWRGAGAPAGATVRRAIVCDGATIGHDATVSDGSVVSFQCVVGPGHTVPKHARVTLCSLSDSASDVDAGSSGRMRSRSGLDDDSGDEDQRLYCPAPTVLAVRSDGSLVVPPSLMHAANVPVSAALCVVPRPCFAFANRAAPELRQSCSHLWQPWHAVV